MKGTASTGSSGEASLLRLYILRHAKSSWATPGLKDFDRGLDERGTEDMPRIAEAMSRKNYLPPVVICSPALRTRMTLHGIMAAYENPPRVDYEETLYSDTPEAYWNAVRAVEEPVDVMIIGHNPMCEIMASEAAPRGDAQALALLRTKYPTGALAVIEFGEDNWSDVRPGRGRLLDFMIPRELD